VSIALNYVHHKSCVCIHLNTHPNPRCVISQVNSQPAKLKLLPLPLILCPCIPISLLVIPGLLRILCNINQFSLTAKMTDSSSNSQSINTDNATDSPLILLSEFTNLLLEECAFARHLINATAPTTSSSLWIL
jgi:hypothetical protein